MGQEPVSSPKVEREERGTGWEEGKTQGGGAGTKESDMWATASVRDWLTVVDGDPLSL